MKQQPWLLADNQLTLFCHVQPAAKQNQISGLHDNCLKIQLKSPPVDGKANKALIEYLAKLCSLPKSSVIIQRGLSSRKKTIIIRDLHKIPDEIKKLGG